MNRRSQHLSYNVFHSRRWLELALLWLVISIGFTLSGCSTGAYPIDIFPEMHYQQSYGSQEPPRITVPEHAIPFTEATASPPLMEVPGITDMNQRQAQSVANPVPKTDATMELASHLFLINCAVCHGVHANGVSFMADKLVEARNAELALASQENRRPRLEYLLDPPRDLTSEWVQNLESGEMYWSLTNGVNNMPSFRKLLTPNERWILVHFIKSVGQGR